MCGRSCSASATLPAVCRPLTASRERMRAVVSMRQPMAGEQLTEWTQMAGRCWPAAAAVGCSFAQALGWALPAVSLIDQPSCPAVCCSRLVGEAEFESPDAADTTVLVTGATGRVGRVLVRKLLLRGYKVKALVRQREGGAAAVSEAAAPPPAAADGSASVDGSEGQEGLPQAAELVYGDVADYKACRQAVKGVDKVGGGCWVGVQCSGGPAWRLSTL